MHFPVLPVLAVLATLGAPVCAQDDGEEGLSLMEEGAQMFLRGLIDELDPAIRELEGMAEDLEPAFRDIMRQMGPALAEIAATIDNIRHYGAPVILDNGDILIPRRDNAPRYEPRPEPEAKTDPDEIEL